MDGINEISSFNMKPVQPGKPVQLFPKMKSYHTMTLENGFQTWCIYEDKQGTVWEGTSNGLAVLDPSTGKFKQYLPKINDPESLHVKDIHCLLEDHKGRLWLGSSGDGLYRFDKKTEKFYHVYDEKILGNYIF